MAEPWDWLKRKVVRPLRGAWQALEDVEEEQPALRRATRAANLLSLLTPAPSPAKVTVTADILRGKEKPQKVLLELLAAPTELTAPIREPALYAISRWGFGYTPEAGPLGDVEAELRRKSYELPGLQGRAVRTGLFVAREATDPLNYIPGIGWGAKGVSKSGVVLRTLAFGVGGGIGGELGREVGERVGGEVGGGIGEIAGTLVGGGLGVAPAIRATAPRATGIQAIAAAAPEEGAAAPAIVTARNRIAKQQLSPLQALDERILAQATAMANDPRMAVPLPNQTILDGIRSQGKVVAFAPSAGPLRGRDVVPLGTVLTTDQDEAVRLARGLALTLRDRPRITPVVIDSADAVDVLSPDRFVVRKPSAVHRIAEAEPGADQLVTLYAGVPLQETWRFARRHPAMTLSTAGAVIGASTGWDTGESPAERLGFALMGAAIGAGVGASPAIIQSRALRKLISPHLDLSADARLAQFQAHEATNETLALIPMIKYRVKELAEIVLRGADFDDATKAAMREAVAAAEPDVAIELEKLYTVPQYTILHMLEYPEKVVFHTDEAKQAFAELTQIPVDIRTREILRGVWRSHDAALRRQYDDITRRLKTVDRKITRAEEAYHKAIRQTERAKQRYGARIDRLEETAAKQAQFAEARIAAAQRAASRAAANIDRVTAAVDELLTEYDQQLTRLITSWGKLDDTARKNILANLQKTEQRVAKELQRLPAPPVVQSGQDRAVQRFLRRVADWQTNADRGRKEIERVVAAAPKYAAEQYKAMAKELAPVAATIGDFQKEIVTRYKDRIAASSKRVKDTIARIPRLQKQLEEARGRVHKERVSGIEEAGAVYQRFTDRDIAIRKQALDKLKRERTRLEEQQAKILHQIESPVDHYVPHVYNKTTPDLAEADIIQDVYIGGRTWFLRDRAFPTYEAAVKAGMKLPVQPDGTPATIGDLFEVRMVASAYMQRKMAFLHAIEREALKQSDVLVPDFVAHATIPKERLRKDYVRLSDEHLRLIVDSQQLIDQFRETVRAIAQQNPLFEKLPKRLQAMINRGRLDFYLRKDWSDLITAEFGPAGSVTRRATGAAEVVKEFTLGWDFFYGGHATVRGLFSIAALIDPFHPRAAMAAVPVMSDGVVRGLQAALFPSAYESFIRSPMYQRAAKYVSLHTTYRTSLEEGVELGTGVIPGLGRQLAAQVSTSRLPRVVSSPLTAFLSRIGVLEEAQFVRMMPVIKAHAFEAMYRFSRTLRPAAPEEQLAREVGRYIDMLFGGAMRWRWNLSQPRDGIERVTFLANKWFRSNFEAWAVDPLRDINIHAAASDPRVAGLLARRMWTTTVGSAVAISTAITLLSFWRAGMLSWDGERPGTKSLLDFADPSNPESPFHPRNIGVVQTAEGVRYNILGPIRPLALLFLRPPLQAAIDSKDRQAWEQGAYEMVRLGIMAFMRTAYESSTEYFSQRLHLPLQVVMDVLQNSDFRGRKIMTKDTRFERTVEAIMYAGSSALPAISQPLLIDPYVSETRAPTLLDVRPLAKGGGGIQEVAGNIVGVQVTTPRPTPEQLEKEVAQFLREQGIYPTMRPLAGYRKAVFSGQLTGQVLRQFQRDHPELEEYFRQRDIERAPQPKVTRENIAVFRAAVARFRAQRDAEMEALSAKYEAKQLSGPDVRNEMERINQRFRIASDGVAAAVLGAADLSDAYEKISAFQRKGRKPEPRTRLQELVDEYYRLAPVDATSLAKVQFLAEREAFWQKVREEDPALAEQLRDQLASRRTVVERDYFRAVELYAEYQKISPYRGITDPDLTRTVNRAIARARDAVTYGLAPNLVTAILTDPTLSDRERGYSLLVVRRRVSNPERRRFLRQNPLIARFFSELAGEQLEMLLARAG